MKKPVIYLSLIYLNLLLFCTVSIQAETIVDQKKELVQLKGEIKKSQGNLNKLKEQESNLINEISDYEQRTTMNQTILNRLNRQLTGIQNQLDSAGSNLKANENNYSLKHNRYINNLQLYYMETSSDKITFAGEIKQQHDALKKIVYLKALAAYDKDQSTAASKYLGEAEQEYSSLAEEERSIGDVRKEKRSEHTILTSQKERKEKDLGHIKRKKEDEADRLVALTEAAQRMEELIGRLEREKAERDRRRAGDINFETGNFIGYKGKLTTPLKGKVIANFGWKTDKKTYLKSYSPGIEIQGQKNSTIKAIEYGIVAYSGNIRGYGNFVIVEHEDGYYSTYAGLEELLVTEDQIVVGGDIIGRTASGKMKFELRKGREPLDPVEWININAFK